MKSRSNLFVIYFLAFFIRLWLANSEFQKDIAQRIEISTPLNSIKRVIEGRYRQAIGVDPYASDLLHESPVLLKFYVFLLDHASVYLPYVFILADIVTAHVLYSFAKRYMLHIFIKQETEKGDYAGDSVDQLLKGRDLYVPPFYVTVVYLFNPYTIFNCTAMTTTTLTNLLLALFLNGIVYERAILSAVTLALATLQSFYPIIMLSPLYLQTYKSKTHLKALASVTLSVGILLGSLYYSRELHGGWAFLDNTFGFILRVTDQQPNVGVFWYFFMEMFEHFRLLFLYSYQMNVTILYVIPLTIKFYNDPSLLSVCFVTLIAIFKSYPCIGDFGLTLALLPCWKHLYNCMQQIFISTVTIIVTTALAPILWDLWIYWGTANANFFFGATLAFITAHIFLVTDISFAYTKREYLLKYGNCRKINGKDAKLVLE